MNNSKIEYILRGIFSCNVPIFFLFVPLLGIFVSFFSYFYITILIVIGYYVTGNYSEFIHWEMFAVFPSGAGFIIAIIFWSIVGALSGYLLYLIRLRFSKSIDGQFPKFGFSGFVFVLAIFFAVGLSLYPVVTNIGKLVEQKKNLDEQIHLEKDCKKIERSNYYFYECGSSVTVPEQFNEMYFNDEDKAYSVRNSLEFPMWSLIHCVEYGGEIYKPENESQVCSAVITKWPKLPNGWEFSDYIYDSKSKKAEFKVKNRYFTLVCTEKSEYCEVVRVN